MLLFSKLNHSKLIDFSIPVKSVNSLLLISNFFKVSGKFSIFFILLFCIYNSNNSVNCFKFVIFDILFKFIYRTWVLLPPSIVGIQNNFFLLKITVRYVLSLCIFSLKYILSLKL